MPSRFDKETRAKTVRLVQEHKGDYESEYAAIKAVSTRLGMTAETLRTRVRQSEADADETTGMPAEAVREIRELERKNAELERTIEILKAATGFVARQCDPRRR
jgi:transposase